MKCVIIPVIIWVTGIAAEGLKKNFESQAGKIFSGFSTKDSCTWNIARNTESTAV